MPIPKPKPDEKETDYVGRCMVAIGGEYDDKDQALAVCYSTFKEGRKKEMNDQLLEAIRQRQAQLTEFGYGIATADRYAKNFQDSVGLEAAYKFAATRTTSWDDVMKKAARTLVYSNPDMVTEEIEYTKRAGNSLKQLDDLELPKNCLMVFRHVLTTPRKDRDGDVLRTQGAKVDPKMILLWNHVHTLPIGKMLSVAEHNSKTLSLYSCIVDMNELSHDCAVMIDNGMGRFSHGFRAIEFTKIKSADGEKEAGFDVKDFEIMEESLVTVPSNTDAEVEDVMLGLVEGGKMTSPLMKEYGRTIRKHRTVQVAGVDLTKVSLPIDLKITLNGKEIETEEKGDTPGHPFRGNQHSGGGGGGGSAAEMADSALSAARSASNRSGGSEVSRSALLKSREASHATDLAEDADGHRKAAAAHRAAAEENTRAADAMDAADKPDVAKLHDEARSRHRRAATIHESASVGGKSYEDMSGDRGGEAEGAGEKGQDDTGTPKEADAKAAGGKAEEGKTDDAEVKCPECGAMVSKSADKCPECGHDMTEEMDEDEMMEKSVKFGRTFSRKNLTTLKEIHGDIDELDRGDHVLSVRGREITGGCRKKLKSLIDEHDIPDDGGVEEGKSFGIEDAMALVISEASSNQRQKVRKAFDAIEEVERMNLQAKQYRTLLVR